MIYLATVTDQFDAPGYSKILDRVKKEFPAEIIIEPAKNRWSLAEWEKEWKRIRRGVTALVVWPRADLSIGRGVWREIRDCNRAHIPILVIDHDGRFLRCSFTVQRINGASFRYWAHIEPTTSVRKLPTRKAGRNG